MSWTACESPPGENRHFRLGLIASVSAMVALAALVVACPPVEAAKSKTPRAEPNCANATAVPTEGSLTGAENSILCLLNSERAKRGLKRLRADRKLALAARNHSDDMVENNYFEHQRRGGPNLVKRVRQTGYLKGVRSFSLGENIAWGTGEYGTPKALMRAWMNSPGHRDNILDPNYKQIGIGLAVGAPASGWDSYDATTATTDFGTRY